MSSLNPLACDLVPPAWPTSVPPVMVILAPEATLSVMIPSTVLESIPSRDVHLQFDLSEQLPLEKTEMPASLMRASAWACVSFMLGKGVGLYLVQDRIALAFYIKRVVDQG